jgi:hypothetical protein
VSAFEAALHMTFMQLAGFPAFQTLGYATQPKAYHDNFARVISTKLNRTTVYCTRVVLTRSNILLLGFASTDINGTSRYSFYHNRYSLTPYPLLSNTILVTL